MSWIRGLLEGKPRLTPEQANRLLEWMNLPDVSLEVTGEQSRYVVVDVESSGLNLRKDRLIAIGAISVNQGKIDLADSLDIVLQQSKVSDRDNILIHGITGTVQVSGVPPQEALLRFLEYLGKSPLVAFHAAFDQTMIGRAIRTYLGFKLEHVWADIAYVAPALYPELARRYRSLDDWLGHFGISNYARHSALADALATAELLLALRGRMTEKGLSSFRHLRDLERARRQMTHPV